MAQKENPVEEKETRLKVDEDRKHQYPITCIFVLLMVFDSIHD